MLISFYSKLVRLKAQLTPRLRISRVMFLFQTGSIKSVVQRLTMRSNQRFYSKLVRLKVNNMIVVAFSERGFYSKLVRLKVTYTRGVPSATG